MFPTDEDFENSLEKFLNDLKKEVDFRKFEKIIVLDDGGHLIEKTQKTIKTDVPIIGVEQTSSGYNRLKSKNISFPIVNMARSWIKLKHESPIITRLAYKKIINKILKLKRRIKNVLIVGNGVIGKHICLDLENNRKFNVSKYDINQKNKSDFLKLETHLSNFDLIIGCSGVTSLPYSKFRFLKKNAILVSLSSSDREFDAANFRKFGSKAINCHTTIKKDDIHLVNCGFPINFDKDFDRIDTDDFQLTRSIVLASVCQAQALTPTNKGWLKLDTNLQNAILKQWKKLDPQ